MKWVTLVKYSLLLDKRITMMIINMKILNNYNNNILLYPIIRGLTIANLSSIKSNQMMYIITASNYINQFTRVNSLSIKLMMDINQKKPNGKAISLLIEMIFL